MPAEREQVLAAGGLHILGTERHESRRIDNQLRGRSGRQGDPGSSRFFLSLEDDLLRIFGADKLKGLMGRIGMEDGVPIEHRWISKAIENAQKKVEAHNFDIRKHLLEYDDVMNHQREVVYHRRKELLSGAPIKDDIVDMCDALIEEIVKAHVETDAAARGMELEGDRGRVLQAIPFSFQFPRERQRPRPSIIPTTWSRSRGNACARSTTSASRNSRRP